MRCEKEHDIHKMISYGKIMADDYNENEFDENNISLLYSRYTI